jgi:hypothetical protein
MVKDDLFFLFDKYKTKKIVVNFLQRNTERDRCMIIDLNCLIY